MRTTQILTRAVAAAVVAFVASSPAFAQWEPYPQKNMPRTPDGKVDLKAPPRRTADPSFAAGREMLC